MHIKIEIPFQRDKSHVNLGDSYMQNDVIVDHRNITLQKKRWHNCDDQYYIYIKGMNTFEIHLEMYNRIINLVQKFNIEEAIDVNKSQEDMNDVRNWGISSPFDISEINALTGLEVE